MHSRLIGVRCVACALTGVSLSGIGDRRAHSAINTAAGHRGHASQQKKAASKKAAPKDNKPQAAAQPKAVATPVPQPSPTPQLTGSPLERSGALTSPSTAEARAEIERTPGAVEVVSDEGLQGEHAGSDHQGCARVRSRRLRPAQVGRRYPPLHSRLGPVAQFPLARHPALHGWHPHQHRGRLWRFPGDRPDGLSLHRGLQGRQRPALRRQRPGRRHQLRDADGLRRKPLRRAPRLWQLRLPQGLGEFRRRLRRHRLLHQRHGAGSGRLPRAQ